MGQYVNLCLRTGIYDEIIDALMVYCTHLENYSDIESCIHLIDFLQGEYEYDMIKQDKEFKEWQEYQKLFEERFKDGEFRDDDGNINNKGMYEYRNFNKINSVLEDYKEDGALDILDDKQQFFLVINLINALDDERSVD